MSFPTPSRLAACLLTAGLLLAAPLASRAETPDADLADDVVLLKQANQNSDGPALRNFFLNRTPTATEQRQIALWIQQLSDESFSVREQATAQLKARGAAVLPQLRPALNDPDPEVRHRAEDCVAAIQPEREGERVSAAARLLAARHPDDASALLLNYLPFAPDDTTVDDVLGALVVLADRDGKPAPVLTAALREPLPVRRMAAALVVGRYGSAEERATVHGLLTDSDAHVRYAAAAGLLAAHERSALPVLTALLTEPSDVAVQAHDLLSRVAADQAPKTLLGDDADARRQCQADWQTWCKANGDKADLNRPELDLVQRNTDVQAQEVTRQFWTALNTKDRAALQRTTDTPFSLGRGQTLTTRQDLDTFFAEILDRGQDVQFKATVLGASSLDANLGSMSEAVDEQFLSSLTRSQVRVVRVRLSVQEGPAAADSGELNMLIRFKGGRARVIGVYEQRGHNPQQGM